MSPPIPSWPPREKRPCTLPLAACSWESLPPPKKGDSKLAENNKKVGLPTTTPWSFGKKILYKLTLPVGAEEVGVNAIVSDWDKETPENPTVSE